MLLLLKLLLVVLGGVLAWWRLRSNRWWGVYWLVEIDINAFVNDLSKLFIDVRFIWLEFQNSLDLLGAQVDGLLHLNAVTVEWFEQLLVEFLSFDHWSKSSFLNFLVKKQFFFFKLILLDITVSRILNILHLITDVEVLFAAFQDLF